ncbi:hypothetical protein GCM10027594_09440 [Hymenobacter agri]
MPKLIDYPRTSYTGAWELAEIVDDTGGKCAIETAARKLNRKVSGSFKAIIGSAVKFGLMTSKRELLTTTTLFRRIKHAYDKAEELQFHREAFLTPPLFTQLCRKFRNRELPVQMLDVMLIREFGVEEINAQNVAKAFVDGCRMCGLLDERNIIADIDALSTTRSPRRELSSTPPPLQSFNPSGSSNPEADKPFEPTPAHPALGLFAQPTGTFIQQATTDAQAVEQDAVASLFGIDSAIEHPAEAVQIRTGQTPEKLGEPERAEMYQPKVVEPPILPATAQPAITSPAITVNGYQMQMSGPGVNTILEITDEDDLTIAIALLEKIRRQLRATSHA